MPLDPDDHGDPAIVVQALELPLPASATTEAVGIHQSDIVIRSALIAGIADLRANPYLLDYCFASLPRDPLTAKEYGVAEVTRAKEWFLKTNIRVFININPNDVQFPCVSIALQSSAEQDAEGTQSDTHYQPTEDRNLEWATIFGPFTPTAYNAETGAMVVDEEVLPLWRLEAGMVLVTKTGEQFIVLDVGDQDFTVSSGAAYADFRDAVIKAPRPAQAVELESAVFREVYGLGCHADSEPAHLTYLHSIVLFTLLRYRQALLEARGFERASLSSTDLTRDQEILPETVYSRYMTVTGTVRQVWPKAVLPKVTGILTITSASQVQQA